MTGLPTHHEVGDHAEIVRATTATAPLVLTCEHATNRLPDSHCWHAEDDWIVETHWAFDLGARDLTHDLARALGAAAVLSRFSRLFADPNRDGAAPDLCREIADGRVVRLNERVSPSERERRLSAWNAFHDAADRVVGAATASVVMAVHTFTPLYEGTPRSVEVGVLFDEETELADRLYEAIRSTGFRVAMNEPWSGKQGLMYSVERHARKHRKRPIEIELRQDLAVDEHARARIVDAVKAFAASAPAP